MKDPYQTRKIIKRKKEVSPVFVDIDGTLLHYVNPGFRHIYRCEYGHEFTAGDLDRVLPVSCPCCSSNSFKRNELLLNECLGITREILSRNISPYPGTVESLRRLAVKYPILYVTARDRRFFKETEVWLTSHRFPYSSPHKLSMRESGNLEPPDRLKAHLIETLNRKVTSVAIIDDDLSLAIVAEAINAQFIWAPVCWEKNTYYGKLLACL